MRFLSGSSAVNDRIKYPKPSWMFQKFASVGAALSLIGAPVRDGVRGGNGGRILAANAIINRDPHRDNIGNAADVSSMRRPDGEFPQTFPHSVTTACRRERVECAETYTA
jgi:hypothetical protein